ncbi:hypothetical protein [Proteus terrae]|uniref:hypothetical protein n=1 Tax=Proteus terrae TaxID=1574161 RepID=UPI0018C5E02D|nr:hypothetical protein [Proteus terrae]MBG2836747.1 hypothetical protein [Proteus terrae subsp. cibarius]MBG2867762.1 hypothetical protein [Proteus terrae subsp. cibarius]
MRKILELSCLWIKEYKHPLRVVGGIFFGLALVSAFFWMGGFDIEPLAFSLGMLSSLFLASPSIAEYFLPNRKQIRHMTYEEIIKFIPTTNPSTDWNGISKEWASEHFLKEDPRLRFRAKYIDDGIQCDNFTENWANIHPDPHAIGYWYDLYYDGAFLDRFILVSVDGGRANIPPPDLRTNTIKLFNYHIGKIHDSMNTLDEYISRSGLTVETS